MRNRGALPAVVDRSTRLVELDWRGTVGVFGLMIKGYRLAPDSASIRAQAMARATTEVGFASEWWKVRPFLGLMRLRTLPKS